MNTSVKENKKITITFLDQEYVLIPELVACIVPDFMGTDQYNIEINLYCESKDGLEPFAELTECFGEFIGQKNCAYVDINNCPFATQLIEQGLAIDTGFTKHSGFCTYPLYRFNEDFLKEVDEKLYALYSDSYDEYMASFMG